MKAPAQLQSPNGKGTMVQIPAGAVTLEGELYVPSGVTGLVLFAHGSGSSRHSPRNQYVAHVLGKAGLGTLLFDLLTEEEGEADEAIHEMRFDMDLLATRLVDATAWAAAQPILKDLQPGYFGASTGGGAALIAAARLNRRIGAVVCRGGRPDLAGHALTKVEAPTLLLVGGFDDLVLRLNEEALEQMHCKKRLQIIPGASHLFEEPRTLEQVAQFSAAWFNHYL